MRETALEEYKQLVEEQGQALLDVVQSVALGDLDVEVEVPEGVDVLSDLAIGLEMMIDDIREMLAELERARAESEQRVAERTKELAATLERVQATQRRYLRQEWEDYLIASKGDRDYFLSESAEGPIAEAWLPAMTDAVQHVDTVTDSDGLDPGRPDQLAGGGHRRAGLWPRRGRALERGRNRCGGSHCRAGGLGPGEPTSV
jgi:hypothetical protein